MNKSINKNVKRIKLQPNYYVYLLLDESGRPFYVGKGCKTRMFQHFLVRNLKHKSTKNQKIKDIKEKTGEWPKVQIVKTELSNKEAFLHEYELITKLGRQDLKTGILTNLTSGGKDGKPYGYKHTEEAKQKISKALKGRKKNVTWGAAISRAMKGKPFSLSHKENLARANRDRTKGKKLEEIYSIQEAARLRKIQQKNLMKKGMTWEQRYGKKKAAQLMAKRATNIGKTWEEIYGTEGAKQRRLAFKQRANSVLLPESVT